MRSSLWKFLNKQFILYFLIEFEKITIIIDFESFFETFGQLKNDLFEIEQDYNE